jgi:hypothetical protein
MRSASLSSTAPSRPDASSSWSLIGGERTREARPSGASTAERVQNALGTDRQNLPSLGELAQQLVMIVPRCRFACHTTSVPPDAIWTRDVSVRLASACAMALTAPGVIFSRSAQATIPSRPASAGRDPDCTGFGASGGNAAQPSGRRPRVRRQSG